MFSSGWYGSEKNPKKSKITKTNLNKPKYMEKVIVKDSEWF